MLLDELSGLSMRFRVAQGLLTRGELRLTSVCIDQEAQRSIIQDQVAAIVPPPPM